MEPTNLPSSRWLAETLKRIQEMDLEEATKEYDALTRKIGEEMCREKGNLGEYRPSPETLQRIAGMSLEQAERSYELLQRKISS